MYDMYKNPESHHKYLHKDSHQESLKSEKYQVSQEI